MNLSIDIIIVPQGAEYRAVCWGLQRASYKNARVARQKPQVIPISIGVNNSLEAMEGKKVLMMGLCGSLSPQHSVGDGVLYRSCYSLDRAFLATNSSLTNSIAARLQDKASLVSGLTGDRVICRATEKQSLNDNYSPTVVDLESFGYVEKFQQLGIAVSILRVVSDDCFSDIPNLDGAIDNEGNLKPLNLAIAFLKQPIPAFNLIVGSLTGLKKLEQLSHDLLIDN